MCGALGPHWVLGLAACCSPFSLSTCQAQLWLHILVPGPTEREKVWESYQNTRLAVYGTMYSEVHSSALTGPRAEGTKTPLRTKEALRSLAQLWEKLRCFTVCNEHFS